MLHDPDSFNGALREAVARRHQWLRPIHIWLQKEGDPPTSITFDARADTVPPAGADDEHFMALADDRLEELAEVLDDGAEWEGYVTQLLRDQIERNDYRE